MSDCIRTGEAIHRALDESIPLPAEAQAHLGRCDACRQAFAELQAAETALASVAVGTTAPRFGGDLAPRVTRRIGEIRRRRRLIGGFAFAAAAALAVALLSRNQAIDEAGSTPANRTLATAPTLPNLSESVRRLESTVRREAQNAPVVGDLRWLRDTFVDVAALPVRALESGVAANQRTPVADS